MSNQSAPMEIDQPTQAIAPMDTSTNETQADRSATESNVLPTSNPSGEVDSSDIDSTLQTLIPRDCPLCFEDATEKMLKCSGCSKKFHHECLRIDEDIVKSILIFYCKQCRSKNGSTTTWKLKVPQRKKAIEKRTLYFHVEKILDWRNQQGDKRQFLVKWKGFSGSQSSWEPEEHLDGCLETLQKFCEDNDLVYSKIEGFVGASTGTTGLNEKNWIKPSTVRNTVLGILSGTDEQNIINIEVWDKLRDQDTLYIVPMEGHCYVVLHYARKGIGYIADGSNHFMTNPEVEKDLTEELGLILIPRQFVQQHGVDHCGSSAVVLALELVKQYRLKIKPDSITADKSIYKRVIKWLHPESSKTIINTNISEFQHSLKCEVCGKKFAKGNQRGYKRHIAYHQSD